MKVLPFLFSYVKYFLYICIIKMVINKISYMEKLSINDIKRLNQSGAITDKTKFVNIQGTKAHVIMLVCVDTVYGHDIHKLKEWQVSSDGTESMMRDLFDPTTAYSGNSPDDVKCFEQVPANWEMPRTYTIADIHSLFIHGQLNESVYFETPKPRGGRLVVFVESVDIGMQNAGYELRYELTDFRGQLIHGSTSPANVNDPALKDLVFKKQGELNKVNDLTAVATEYTKHFQHHLKPMTHNVRRVDSKINAFVNIAQQIASLSTSSRLKVGCIVFKKDFSKIAAIGYNGSYPNAPIYEETGTEEESLEPGMSGFVHAEINAVTKFNGHSPEKYIVLVTHSPCAHCTKVLVNAGFRDIFWIDEYRACDHLADIFSRVGVNHGNVEALKALYAPEDPLKLVQC
ncbi:hypothetical protein MA9V2_025 [Chryseobacterium phage MA9V-2]|nr:hypothetical protein MA9V2_025 [Chryseobacterium phage MA9V-2]